MPRRARLGSGADRPNRQTGGGDAAVSKPIRTARACLLIATAAASALGLPSAVEAAEQGRSTWFVRAGAAAGGAGTPRAPFNSLTRVEAVSDRGDRIVVLPARRPLNGGTRLKPRQRLIGAGAAVRKPATRRRAPRITNTKRSRLGGDAVRLANRTTVRNLEITRPYRGAVYGRN